MGADPVKPAHDLSWPALPLDAWTPARLRRPRALDPTVDDDLPDRDAGSHRRRPDPRRRVPPLGRALRSSSEEGFAPLSAPRCGFRAPRSSRATAEPPPRKRGRRPRSEWNAEAARQGDNGRCSNGRRRPSAALPLPRRFLEGDRRRDGVEIALQRVRPSQDVRTSRRSRRAARARSASTTPGRQATMPSASARARAIRVAMSAALMSRA